MAANRSALRKAIAKQKRVQKTAKLGGGKRFAALKSAIAARGGVHDPGAVAAAIGRKKFGQKAMTRMSVAAKMRHSH